MKTMARPGVFAIVLVAFFIVAGARPAGAAGPLDWPPASAQARPWAFWWWMGSAVNAGDITRELERYQKAGMGGVHNIPIYGAKGFERQAIEYFSPRWMEMLAHSVGEARRLGMDCDMTLGTGWCFGGPNVSDRDANASMVVKTVAVAGGSGMKDRFDPKETQALVAFSEAGETVELTTKIKADGTVDWIAPAGKWKVYAVSQKPSRQKVKRPAPGGAGYMLNPFYGQAIKDYLPRFEEAFAKYEGLRPRAVYQDSYEYNSNWSADFFAQFEKRRGYRLQDQLPALLDDAKENDVIGRVKGDYRETISNLMVEEFMPPWVTWAHDRKMITRTQSHGSPGNLLDLYAAADVPETEMFSKDRNPLVAKFASSAAHVTGKKLTSSETGTWLAEHFTETLGEMKRLQDELFVSGVNHIFYHGTCYSPDDAAWPGWCFYAATEMNPRNAIWHDVPALNAYVARCQSVLQAGTPDNDVLLYWPIHDLWHSLNGMVMPLTVHHTDWLTQQAIGRDAKMLWGRGYGFDYVSDRQLKSAPARYRAVVVPPCSHIPVETMAKLIELARGGATVIFHDRLPEDVPGLGELEKRRAELRKLAMELNFTAGEKFKAAAVGEGRIVVGDLEAALAAAGAAREPLADHAGLLFIRRTWEGGHHCFIANQGEKALDEWVPLGRAAKAVALLDPLTGRAGFVATRDADGRSAVRLQLEPGQSVIVRTFSAEAPDGAKWAYEEFAGKPIDVTGKWSVKFVQGGPELPDAYETSTLASWTERADERAKAFAGSAVYTITFDAPPGAQRAILDLGKVCHSARVRLNGSDVRTVIMAPYRVRVDQLKDAGNVLEVEVTNLSANRIRDLDRRGVKWKNFEDINVVNIDYKPFDASKWAVRESGLMGPVTVTALKQD
ncbi:MAG: glycoside hydrolase family 2 sugar binding protein [Phycisphaerales bacterium]|nr:glycoside hydrolase family 2 sugar binding protein [Phycisphaerales bacterium]